MIESAHADVPSDLAGLYTFKEEVGDSFIVDTEYIQGSNAKARQRLRALVYKGYDCRKLPRQGHRCYKKLESSLPADIRAGLIADHRGESVKIEWKKGQSELISEGDWLTEWLLQGKAQVNGQGDYLLRFRKLRRLEKLVLQEGSRSKFEYLYAQGRLKRWVKVARGDDVFWLQIILTPHKLPD